MFKFRSQKKELLDTEQIPEKDLFKNLKELDFINYWLGGYRVTFAALKKVLKKDQENIIVDIGSGGGDTLKRIRNWDRGGRFHLYGIDLKPVCVQYADTNQPDESIRFICDDYRNVFRHVPEATILHASLFCHHLTENQIVDLILFANEQGAILVINDLERNPFAYFSIRFLTALFSGSYLVKHDAPLSVLRGFRKKEWIDMIRKAGAGNFSVQNKWAFRHEVIVYPNPLISKSAHG